VFVIVVLGAPARAGRAVVVLAAPPNLGRGRAPTIGGGGPPGCLCLGPPPPPQSGVGAQSGAPTQFGVAAPYFLLFSAAYLVVTSLAVSGQPRGAEAANRVCTRARVKLGRIYRRIHREYPAID